MSEMIGRLRVALGLETASFEKGAKRAGAEIDAFGSKAEKAGFAVGRTVKAIAAGGAALAGSAVVSQLKSMVEESLRSIKAMKDLAQVSNSSIAEFQAVAFAAGTVGVEMDKLADIYKDMNDRVGEFLETGGGPMKDFFTNIAPKVGVTAAQFKDLSGPQALQLYVSSLEKAGVNQQQMTFYLEAMSGDLTKLLPLLQNNGAGMRKLSDDAKRMGIVLDDNLVKNAGEASRTMDTLNTVLSMQITSAVAANAKEIAAFTTTLTQFAISAIKAFNAWNQFNGSMDERAVAQKKLAEKIDKRAREQGLSPERKARALEVGNQVLDKIYGVAPVSQGSGWSMSNNPLWSLKTVTPKTNYTQNGGLIGNGAIGAMAGMQGGAGESWDKIVWDQADRLAAVQGVLADDSRKSAAAVDQSADDIAVANERIKLSFGEMAQDSIYALQRLTSAVQGGGFLDILGAVIGVTGNIAGMFGGRLGFGSAGSINKSALASLRGTALPSIPAYANGTSFHPGGLALVGEKGPEIARLPRGTAVYPNGMGPGGVTNNYFSGNLMTPQFWAMIQNGDRAAAQIGATAGAEGGFAKVAKASSRRLGY